MLNKCQISSLVGFRNVINRYIRAIVLPIQIKITSEPYFNIRIHRPNTGRSKFVMLHSKKVSNFLVVVKIKGHNS